MFVPSIGSETARLGLSVMDVGHNSVRTNRLFGQNRKFDFLGHEAIINTYQMEV